VSSGPYIPNFELILASQSPRRRQLLTQANLPHSVRPSEIPELRGPAESAQAYVARLSQEKASATARLHHQAVLAADTTVVLDSAAGQLVLEKPDSASHAYQMIEMLAGRSHSVLTGVCLQWHEQEWLHVEKTIVHFAPMTPLEIQTYVDSGECFDKAGAYGIQGLASRHISHIEGCYFNVIGLPLHRIYKMLAEAGALA
jgi:septum formation protein